jgi:hypothetical protein
MHIQDGSKYTKLFFGKQFGVGLLPRGENDPHVLVQLLSEDDENWFPSEQPTSSYWTSDLQAVLSEAQGWMEANCDPDKDGYGWQFKP